MNRQTSSHVICHVISTKVLTKMRAIGFFQQIDNFLKYRITVLCDEEYRSSMLMSVQGQNIDICWLVD